MSGDDALKLTTYFGERDRSGGRFLADALIDIYARRGLRMSVLLRGTEGFGFRHRLQTQRLLTLSEDLPIVSVAVDTRERIEAALPEVVDASSHGLVTLERARFAPDREATGGEQAKLTVYVGRQQRVDGAPAFLAVVDLLHRRRISGATALLGVDGTAHGVRQRARFFGANAAVPMMIISVGDADRIGAAVSELADRLDEPLMTLERVRVLKRDGQRLAPLGTVPETDTRGRGLWQKLMVYAGEQARHDGRPLYSSLVRRLRAEGAAGATALRAVWGYHGAHAPHGDKLWSVRRNVPIVTVIVDTPKRMERWFAIVDELTDEGGLVTAEIVPAFRAAAPGTEYGGLALADPP